MMDTYTEVKELLKQYRALELSEEAKAQLEFFYQASILQNKLHIEQLRHELKDAQARISSLEDLLASLED
jgi:hypothetical protein